jgi:hypothetical protein
MSNAMIMKFLHSFANLQDTLQTISLAHLIIFTQIEGVPNYQLHYHSDPPEQYSVIYHTASG